MWIRWWWAVVRFAICVLLLLYVLCASVVRVGVCGVCVFWCFEIRATGVQETPAGRDGDGWTPRRPRRRRGASS